MSPSRAPHKASCLIGMLPLMAPNETVRGIAALAALPVDAEAAEAVLTVAATSLPSLRLRPHGRPCWQGFIAVSSFA